MNDTETYAQIILGKNQTSSVSSRKVLGVLWNNEVDELILDFREIISAASMLEPTKRHIVSIVGKFYDPLGLATPLIVRFKILVQDLCKAQVPWDRILHGELLERWQSLICDLKDCQSIKIPRHFAHTLDQVDCYQLCGFSDASNAAYAAVVFLLMKNGELYSSRLIASKTRVAPLQQQTTPRLKLLETLLLARLITSVANSLRSEITLEQAACYSDSQIALCWIQGLEREWKLFIQIRVSEIRKLVPVGSWKFCPGKENPADLPSKGVAPVELCNCKLWWNGPDWLGVGMNNYVLSSEIPYECMSELKDTKNTTELFIVLTPSISNIIDITKFGTLNRLINVVSLILKFFRKLRKQFVESINYQLEAEKLLLQEVQGTLTARKDFLSLKRHLDLFCDESGIWRCGGRLGLSNLPYTTRYPIVLPRDHYFSILVIGQAHARVMHNGVKETLVEIRSKYWLIKGRALLKSVILKCNVCKRFEGAAYRAPPPPPLPSFRVTEHPPFTYTGVDFAGPLIVRPDHPVNASCDQKVWICLYTCCVTRAVHIDIVPNLSSQSFLRSFKRFTSRRGLPHKMVSDNGTTFKSAARIIRQIVQDETVSKYLSGLKVEWCFNIEKAPW